MVSDFEYTDADGVCRQPLRWQVERYQTEADPHEGGFHSESCGQRRRNCLSFVNLNGVKCSDTKKSLRLNERIYQRSSWMQGADSVFGRSVHSDRPCDRPQIQKEKHLLYITLPRVIQNGLQI